VVRRDHADADVQHRGRPAVHRLLGKVGSDRRGARCRPGMARGSGGRAVGRCSVLLPARREADVFRRSHRQSRDRGRRHLTGRAQC
jgi:hypothetical protein